MAAKARFPLEQLTRGWADQRLRGPSRSRSSGDVAGLPGREMRPEAPECVGVHVLTSTSTPVHTHKEEGSPGSGRWRRVNSRREAQPLKAWLSPSSLQRRTSPGCTERGEHGWQEVGRGSSRSLRPGAVRGVAHVEGIPSSGCSCSLLQMRKRRCEDAE